MKLPSHDGNFYFFHYAQNILLPLPHGESIIHLNDMAKKWNDYTRREKMIGVFGAIFGVFVISSMANGANVPAPSQTKPATVQTQPQTSTKEVSESVTIPFDTSTVESSQYDKGSLKVTTMGINGEKIVTYKVTFNNGVESSRETIKEEVTKAPVSEITTLGTYVKPTAPEKQASTCDPNYSNACVPIASDVDCAGGKGNGPAYVRGPVYVIGKDIYGLDGNSDGVGCE